MSQSQIIFVLHHISVECNVKFLYCILHSFIVIFNIFFFIFEFHVVQSFGMIFLFFFLFVACHL